VVQTDSDAARARGEPNAGSDADADAGAAADAAKSRRFQQLALPHLDAAYNLARWLCGNPHDAEDVVQEAFMRAFRFFDTFRGDSARPWLLAIVRRTWYTEWRRRAPSHDMLEFDETMDDATLDGWSAGGDDPQTLLIRDEDARQVHAALARLPVEYREVLILRELEEMGYREIALVADVPIGTVMSRLARGRRKLAEVLMAQQNGGGEPAGAGHKGGQAGRRAAKDGSDGQVAQSGPAGHAVESAPSAGSAAASPAGRPVLSGASASSAASGASAASSVCACAASPVPSESPAPAVPVASSGRSTSSSGDARTASSARGVATARVMQLRAFADGRPLNIPGAVADPAQETPDGL
jgi:RNA polymerase sigma factor (sigma-70 family)